MGIIKNAKERLAAKAVDEWTSIQGHWETAKKLFPYVKKYPDEAPSFFGKEVVSILEKAAWQGGIITTTNKCVSKPKLKKLIRRVSLATILILLRKDFWKNAEAYVQKCEELDKLYPSSDDDEDVDIEDDEEEDEEPKPEKKEKKGKKNDKDFEDVK